MSRLAELFESTKWFSGVMCGLSSGVKPEDVDQWRGNQEALRGG